METREEQLLERERALIKRERGYIGQRMALAETARGLADRARTLHERANANGPSAAAVAKLTAPRPDRFADDDGKDYEALEVAQPPRYSALEARELAVRKRQEALSARARGIEHEEKALEYRQELYRLRAQELERIESSLTDLEVADLSAPPAAPAPSPSPHDMASPSPPPAASPAPATPAPGAPASGLHSPPPLPSASGAPASPGAAPGPDDDDDDDERRRQNRYGLKVFVGLESEHNFYTGFSRNISRGGLFIATHDVLDIGQEVELLFQLPSGTTLHTHGQVTWIRRFDPDKPDKFPGMGVKFIDLSPEESAYVRDFLEDREPILYED